MSGELNPPLLAPDKASKLLDEIIYERVLACIDVDALLHFECELSCAFAECRFDGAAGSSELAREMIDRALHRVRDERWQAHLRSGRSIAAWDYDSCDEIAPEPKLMAKPKPKPKRTSS
jgi:hypothetical protein